MYIYSEKQEELYERLLKIAHQVSSAFCYTDYIKVTADHCPKCGSDDLMRITQDDGPEWGYDWIIENLIVKSNVKTIDIEHAINQIIDDCYGDTVKIGFIEYSTSEAIKELDPVAWKMFEREEVNRLLDEENVISFDEENHIYWASDIETLIEELNMKSNLN